MADKHPELNPRWLDRRVVERYLKKGLLDEKEYQRYLKSLPDLAENAARLETEFQPAGELGPSR
jgi:hypothetical protein